MRCDWCQNWRLDFFVDLSFCCCCLGSSFGYCDLLYPDINILFDYSDLLLAIDIALRVDTAVLDFSC